MRYGFVIDNRKCIGCHACSVACKSENQVPLGVFRTWVRCVDKGQFPRHAPPFPGHTLQSVRQPTVRRRYALWLRCTGAATGSWTSTPRVASAARRACRPAPTTLSTWIPNAARRPSATSALIGSSRDAAGVRGGLPRAGDHRRRPRRPGTVRSSRLIDHEPVRVRRPEKQTRPKLFYVGAEEAVIVPGQARNVGTYLFATANAEDAPGAHAARARPLARAHGAGDRVLRRGALAAVGLAGAGLLLDQVGLDWHPGPPGARPRAGGTGDPDKAGNSARSDRGRLHGAHCWLVGLRPLADRNVSSACSHARNRVHG